MAGHELDYHLVDVFTGKALQGNQLAVFLDAAALTDAEMQAIADQASAAMRAIDLNAPPAPLVPDPDEALVRQILADPALKAKVVALAGTTPPAPG